MNASERPSRRWQVLLNCGGDSSSARRPEFDPKDRGVFSPMVSKEQYEADRRRARLSSIPRPARQSAALSDPGSEKPMLHLLQRAR